VGRDWGPLHLEKKRGQEAADGRTYIIKEWGRHPLLGNLPCNRAGSALSGKIWSTTDMDDMQGKGERISPKGKRTMLTSFVTNKRCGVIGYGENMDSIRIWESPDEILFLITSRGF